MSLHLFCSLTKLPSLELKTRPKQLLGYLPLDVALNAVMYYVLSLQAPFTLAYDLLQRLVRKRPKGPCSRYQLLSLQG
jgi:hypothetical protein